MATISYVKGDVFSAPPGSILVHAYNTQGAWGCGTTLTFRDKYPTQKRDSPDQILAATKNGRAGSPGQKSCNRFNSGKIAVPWADTEAVLKDLNVTMTIYTAH
ncbi:hypothetical protein CVT25_000473 [Psilocybe cyanescens]|uniref:ADP-ribose 1''-phosphate phosphatase n=1 Tax=Psilocybe cyanescens TaxID=93625 RepID=A0A409VP19_PSICY|nr:hypothetical protein CVT25_000473 [Psilocybe cyanescens]